jgi:C4-dicarboxylate-specific signal transduction histidine kinase
LFGQAATGPSRSQGSPCLCHAAVDRTQIVDCIRDHIKKAPPRRDRYDLNGAGNEVIVLLKGEIVDNRVSVQTHLANGGSIIEGDRVQLQQVVMNLVVNAIEAMSWV